MTADEIIPDLHDSEINGRLEWVYDGAWTAAIGNPLSGDVTEATLGSFAEAVRVMCFIQHAPVEQAIGVSRRLTRVN